MVKLVPKLLQRIIAIMALCLFAPVTAFADWGESFLYVGCEAERGLLRVEPLVVWNEDLEAITPAVERNEGLIKTNGHQLYSLDARPVFNATCTIEGATIGIVFVRSSKEIRLFENDVLISSNSLYDLKRILGYRVRYTTDNGWAQTCGGRANWYPITSNDLINDCIKNQSGIYGEVLARERSVVEIFLAEPSLQQLPMTYKTVSGQGEVCRRANSYLNNRFLGKETKLENLKDTRNGSGTLSLPKRVLGGYVPPSIFDFDNDGHSDRVFSYSGGGSYITGDILYVDFDYSTNPSEDLTVNDVHVFPCQLDSRVSSSSECPTVSQEADGAGVQVTFEGEEPVFFRGRYTSITPYSHDGITYLILESNSGDTEYYASVIKVYAKTKHVDVCLLKRMP